MTDTPRHLRPESDEVPSERHEYQDTTREFVEALTRGIGLVKHDRNGHSRVRELYTPDEGVTFSWREPSKASASPHHQRVKSGGGVFDTKRAVYAFADIVEVSSCRCNGSTCHALYVGALWSTCVALR
jgi:hypothetical protein